MLSFEEIEDCFPEGAEAHDSGNVLVTAQWLHNFAHAVSLAERSACLHIAETTAAGRDAEAIADAIRLRGNKGEVA